MRCLTFFILLTLFFCSCSDGLDVLPESINIVTQKDLDRVKCQFEGLTTYSGNLQFHIEEPLKDLDVFKDLEIIEGNFSAKSQEQLDAFPKLTSVFDCVIKMDGYAKFESIEEVTNFLIFSGTHLDMPSLKFVESFVSSSPLEVLGDFSSLDSISHFNIQTQNLKRIEDFSSVRSIGTFLIHSHDAVEISSKTFESLQFVNQFEIIHSQDNETMSVDWISKIDSFNHFYLGGPITREQLCEELYPSRYFAGESFTVWPSLELLNELGLFHPNETNLDVSDIEDICE